VCVRARVLMCVRARAYVCAHACACIHYKALQRRALEICSIFSLYVNPVVAGKMNTESLVLHTSFQDLLLCPVRKLMRRTNCSVYC
jgi:hypothetical protein